jgi:hypothetical protein
VAYPFKLKVSRAIHLSGARIHLNIEKFVVSVFTWEGSATFTYENLESAMTFYLGIISAIKSKDHYLDTRESGLPTGKLDTYYENKDLDDLYGLVQKLFFNVAK